MTVKEMIKTEIEKLPENLLAEVLGGKQGQIPFNISRKNRGTLPVFPKPANTKNKLTRWFMHCMD